MMKRGGRDRHNSDPEMSVGASMHVGLLTTTKALCTSGTGEPALDRTRTLFRIRCPGFLPSKIGYVYRTTYDQPKKL